MTKKTKEIHRHRKVETHRVAERTKETHRHREKERDTQDLQRGTKRHRAMETQSHRDTEP